MRSKTSLLNVSTQRVAITKNVQLYVKRKLFYDE